MYQDKVRDEKSEASSCDCETAAPLRARTRVINITVVVDGISDQVMQPYVDRVIAIWTARGGGKAQFTELLDYDRIKITLTATAAN